MQEGLVLVEHRRIMGPKCVGHTNPKCKRDGPVPR